MKHVPTPPFNLSDTGESGIRGEYGERSRLIECPLGDYEALVRVSEDGRFMGVAEIRVNKDFRSFPQRMASAGHHNVEQFYEP